MTDKIKKAFEEYDNQIELLKIKRNEEIYNTINEINSKYERMINIKKLEKRRLNNIEYLNSNDSIQAIEYLVNQIEEENYYKVMIPIKYNGKYLTKMGESYIINNFYVFGLTKDKEKVEIKPNEIYTEDELNNQYDNFLKLYHYNKNFGDIHINVNYLSNNYNAYCNNMSSNVDSYICDERFSYIKDYIEKVIEYRLDKKEYKINLDDMIKIADIFIVDYKNAKKLVKK